MNKWSLGNTDLMYIMMSVAYIINIKKWIYVYFLLALEAHHFRCKLIFLPVLFEPKLAYSFQNIWASQFPGISTARLPSQSPKVMVTTKSFVALT